jgi:hypothetical protein
MAAFTRRQYKGAAAATTITSSMTTSSTSVTISATTGWPSTAGVPFYVVIDPGTSAEEKCSATISGSTLTVTRAQDDTTASAHSIGATIYPVFTANDADEANELVSKLTTKGDLLATDGSVLNRLAVGTNDYALLADSSATNGVAWKQVPAAGIASDAVTTAKILDANVTGAKLANFTVDTKTGDYTFVVGDRHKRIVANKSTAITFTVPNSVFSAGDTLFLHNINSGTLSVAAGAGVTLNSLSSDLLQWQGATLYATSASSFILFPTGGSSKVRKVDAFTSSGTWTVPTGVTYAVANIRAGGGGMGGSANAGGTGGTSSVAFASGTVSATGGTSGVGTLDFNQTFIAGTANSGQGAWGQDFRGADVGDSRVFRAQDGAFIVAGAAVTAGASITVTVGAGGTGTSGAAGGSGYVWIEYEV